MGRKPRGLTEADRAAWAAYAERIAALPGRVAAARPAAPAASTSQTQLTSPAQPTPSSRHALPAPPTSTAQPEQSAQLDMPAPAAILPPRPPPRSLPGQAARRALAVGDPPGGVDGATWQRLRGGKFIPERKLDLHGLTAQRAYHALVAFLRTAHADRVRCVEVVTGRGSGDETGVLRRELPMWLNRPDLRPLVLAAAHPHAANPGAVRLLLRRVR